MLEVRDLTVSHGVVEAVRGVSLDLAHGEIVLLIGANGAGKSSLLEAISGIKRPVGGSIRLDGVAVESEPAHAVLARGVAHVPEDRMIFTRLTVGENLTAGAAALRSVRDVETSRDDVLADFPELAGRLEESALALSGGQRQLLAVARGLMARPRLMLLDEPTLGLSPVATARIFGLVADLKKRGLGILMVDQNMNRALDIADRAYVLDKGRVVLAGRPHEVRADARLAQTYLGTKTGRIER